MLVIVGTTLVSVPCLHVPHTRSAPTAECTTLPNCCTSLRQTMAAIDDFEGSYDDYGSDFEDESRRNGAGVRPVLGCLSLRRLC